MQESFIPLQNELLRPFWYCVPSHRPQEVLLQGFAGAQRPLHRLPYTPARGPVQCLAAAAQAFIDLDDENHFRISAFGSAPFRPLRGGSSIPAKGCRASDSETPICSWKLRSAKHEVQVHSWVRRQHCLHWSFRLSCREIPSRPRLRTASERAPRGPLASLQFSGRTESQT